MPGSNLPPGHHALHIRRYRPGGQVTYDDLLPLGGLDARGRVGFVMGKPDDLVVADERAQEAVTSEILIVSLGNAVSRTQGGNRSDNENKREIYA